MAGKDGDSAVKAIVVAVLIALLAGGSAPWWLGKLFPSTSTPSNNIPTQTNNASKPPALNDNSSNETKEPRQPTHCAKPTAPVLVDPGNNTVQPNHYYGQGDPWRFRWLDSSCEGGAIQGYRIVVTAEGGVVPAIDKFVKSAEYVGDVTGTISAANWSWKVRAVDDQNQLSDWSEERKFFVGPWKQ